ncbi:MAG: ribonuclease domain-containing protein [Gammaproteobacteria bacterium]
MRRVLIPLLVILIGGITLWQQQAGTTQTPALPDAVDSRDEERADRPAPSGLPSEALDTLELIRRGGPFPHRQDGTVFGNREGLLPAADRGYYREYTVPTPGERDRGARRIVTGGDPPAEWYYTDDHYRSFRSIAPEENAAP